MNSQPIGRDAEIAQINAFLSATTRAPAALAITGDAGIGKTVMWKHVIQTVNRSSRVVSCRPTSAERPLAFSALDDLFGDVADEVLPALPGPRRRAVEAALLREVPLRPSQADLLDTNRPSLERRALARGVLDVLRILSDGVPLTLAIDDAQWLDRPSARVLEFCFRRLQREPVSILLTFQEDAGILPFGLDGALPPESLGRVKLGPLSLGALGEILQSRLGAVFPRYTLTRLNDACGGNPFYAIESARALIEQQRTSLTSEPIPIPHSLSDPVRRRLRRLTQDARLVGRLIAASSDPREGLIRAAYGDRESWAAIDQAIDAGIIERDGDALRFTHPLLRSVLYAEMTLNERRNVHQRLAAKARDIEERAWHLALSAQRPSDEIADMLGAAASRAASRGSPETAAALQEQAMRLTPASRSQDIRERTVHAADYHFLAGGIARSQELIQSALGTCPAGSLRASLLLRLATIHYHQSGWPLAAETFRQAAQEAPEDSALSAHAEQELAFARLMAGNLPDASRLARTSLRSAEKAADPCLVAHSLARVAAFEFFQGNGIRSDLLEKAEKLYASAGEEPIGRLPLFGPSLVRGLVLKWCDRLDEARVKLADGYRRALDRGNEASLPFLLYHFSELECWAGNWDLAEEYALESCRVAEECHQQAMRPVTLYSLALIRAHRGQVQQARELASEALNLGERTGNVPVTSMALSVLGFVALSLDDYKVARPYLSRAADTIAALGLDEPSVVKVLPDHIEVLVALGELTLARSFTRQLEAQGESLGRPWALATGARCRAHLAAVSGEVEEARAACEEALSRHEQLQMPFELGRTLLVQGMIERRARHRSAARASFGQALSIFEHLGAPLWADKARRELSKIATIRSPADGLTETERRVATLVAEGQTNREVAAAMFVTENTVQTHVRHIFQKLGVRSRTALAARFLSPPAPIAATPQSSAGSQPGPAR